MKKITVLVAPTYGKNLNVVNNFCPLSFISFSEVVYVVFHLRNEIERNRPKYIERYS